MALLRCLTLLQSCEEAIKKYLLLAFFVCVATGTLFSTQSKQRAAFDKLLSLAGDWEGTVAWTGDAPSQISADYHTTGNGSAVVEDLSSGMTSVYHLDGNDLRMTHFCAPKTSRGSKQRHLVRTIAVLRFHLWT